MRGKLAMAAFSCILTASTISRAEILNPTCTQSAPGEYKLAFQLSGDTKKVQILAGAQAGDSKNAALLASTAENSITVHAGNPGERIYFFLRPDHGHEREVSLRHIPLEGTPNFRDLGGYETTDGRFVRWGKLYRSGVLSYLTPGDLKTLNQLGIRLVCDFRSKQENDAAPEVWESGTSLERLSLPIYTQPASSSKEDPMQQILAANPSPEQLRAMMTQFYAGFAFQAAPEYARVFTELKQDRLPLAYHCTAGKDRTGVFSAFVLLTLGVPEETVLSDYALTNKYLAEGMNTEAARKMMGSSGEIFAHLSPEQRQALMAADPAYLRSALRAIDAKYGSFENYRRQELHVSDADRDALQKRLLTN